MDKIIFPLKQRMKGPEVANLQDALQFLLDHGKLLADKFDRQAIKGNRQI